MNHQKKLSLIPRETLIKTGDVDEADWNYQPILGYIQRRRFKLIMKLLSDQKFFRLLEVGYGSGIFMKQLAQYCDELYGVDIHECNGSVQDMLSKLNVKTQLFSENATSMHFEQNFFDCIVAVSTIEFIDDIHAACVEFKRILKPQGFLIIVTPGHSPVVDMGLRILTGVNAKSKYKNRRQVLSNILMNHFNIEKKLTFPSFPPGFRLYTAYKLYTKS